MFITINYNGNLEVTRGNETIVEVTSIAQWNKLNATFTEEELDNAMFSSAVHFADEHTDNADILALCRHFNNF